MLKYIVKDGKPVREPDVMKWARRFEDDANRRMAHTKVRNIEISTVFLGIDHSFGTGPPILYETMVFGGQMDGHQERYCTADEAKAGHQRIVKRVKMGRPRT